MTTTCASHDGHGAWNKKLRRRGTITNPGFCVNSISAPTTTKPFWNATAPRTPERQLSELPLVRASLIDFLVIPLMAYSGFARLFGRPSKPR
jgi:hypothetical protein